MRYAAVALIPWFLGLCGLLVGFINWDDPKGRHFAYWDLSLGVLLLAMAVVQFTIGVRYWRWRRRRSQSDAAAEPPA